MKKLPTSENNLSGKVDIDALFAEAMKQCRANASQQQAVELLRTARDAATLKAVCDLLEPVKFESYKPDALAERARWRAGRLDKACAGMFGEGRLSVLEIGAGRGEMLAALMEEHDVQCVGLDPVESLFIDNRKNVAGLYDALMLKGVAEDIPFCEGSFDIILGYNSMEHFADPAQVVDECHRVLKPGGAMYFWFGPPFNGPYGPHLQNRIGLPYFHHLFEKDVVAEHLGTAGDVYAGKNGWSTQRFRELFTDDPRFVCSHYREEYVWRHLWLVSAFPDEFAEFSPSELCIRALEVACRKDGAEARKRFLANQRASGGIDLSRGVVETQDGRTNNAILRAGKQRFGIKLNNTNDPKKGDFTRYRLAIAKEPGTRSLLSLRVHNSYQNPSYTGRVSWTLRINGERVGGEDISTDRAANTFEIPLDATLEAVEVELHLDAGRNCEPWSWGDASKLWIDEVKLVSDAHSRE